MFALLQPTKNNGGIGHVLITDKGVALFHMVAECKELPLLIKAILESIPAQNEESEILKGKISSSEKSFEKRESYIPSKNSLSFSGH